MKTTAAARRRKWLIISVVAFCALGLLTGLVLYRGLTLRRYALAAGAALPPLHFMLVSDLHSVSYGEGQREILSMISSQNPDAIFLAGDFFDSLYPSHPSLAFFEGVTAIAPCFFISGNHDLWRGAYDAVLPFLEGLGIMVLDGDTAAMDVRGRRVYVSGIGDPTYDAYTDDLLRNLRQLDSSFSSLPGDGYRILLAHRPELIDWYARYGFDLVLSGHTHGGQVRIPLLLNGLYAPPQGWFARYTGGLYRVGDTALIISRGCSYYPQIPRIFNPPEICLINVD